MKPLFYLLLFATLSTAAHAQTIKFLSLAHTDYSAANTIMRDWTEACSVTFDNGAKTVTVKSSDAPPAPMPMVAFKKSPAVGTAKPTLDWAVKDKNIKSYTLITNSRTDVYLLEKYKDGHYRKYTKLTVVK